jgi:hypothetical protein
MDYNSGALLWELQGFGNYNFGREVWTYGSKFRFATEQGLYKYQFTVPADWKDRKCGLSLKAP